MLKTITTLLVDDEDLARENLDLLIQDFCPKLSIVGKATGKADAEKKIKQLNPQVVFLDIQMPSGIEGIELLETFPNPDFLVIFVTAFKEYAVKAFNLNAIHYLLKPIDLDDLMQAYKKIIKKMDGSLSNEAYQNRVETAIRQIKDHEHQKVSIPHLHGIKVVNQSDIVYLQADSNCTHLHFKDGTKYTDTRTLKVYQNLLNQNTFYRTHKSYMVNSNFIEEYITSYGTYVKLENKVEVPVSRSNQKKFREWLKQL